MPQLNQAQIALELTRNRVSWELHYDTQTAGIVVLALIGNDDQTIGTWVNASAYGAYNSLKMLVQPGSAVSL